MQQQYLQHQQLQHQPLQQQQQQHQILPPSPMLQGFSSTPSPHLQSPHMEQLLMVRGHTSFLKFSKSVDNIEIQFTIMTEYNYD